MTLEKLKNDPRMPKHMAIIVDGNGRWAKAKGFSRSMGHKHGFDNLKKHIKFIQEAGVKNLSLYCFSQQNWNRPEKEVTYLMELFDQVIDDFKKDYTDKDVRVMVSGDLNDPRIPDGVAKKVEELQELTKDKTSFVLNICFNYGGREEIIKAVNEIIESGEHNITEEMFEKHLYTADLLPVDFVLRTSGEQRTSNFLPWQSTYSEWYFPKKNWPSFTKRDLIKAFRIFIKRNRRFGAVKG